MTSKFTQNKIVIAKSNLVFNVQILFQTAFVSPHNYFNPINTQVMKWI